MHKILQYSIKTLICKIKLARSLESLYWCIPVYLCGAVECMDLNAQLYLDIKLCVISIFCQAFWNYAPVVEPYIREHSKPLWNGEDIFFSLVSYKMTGQIPLIVRGAKVFLSQRSSGIHFIGGHDSYRDDFLKHAVRALELRYPQDSEE